MQDLTEHTTIKLEVEDNICSLKVIEGSYDLNQIVLSVKENIEIYPMCDCNSKMSKECLSQISRTTCEHWGPMGPILA